MFASWKKWVVVGAAAVCLGTTPGSLAMPASAAMVDSTVKVELVEPGGSRFAAVTVQVDWSVVDDSKAGDQFTVQLPEALRASEGLTFEMASPAGDLVATGTVKNSALVVTLTEFVESHVGVHGVARIQMFLNTAVVGAGQTVDVEFQVGATIYRDTYVSTPIDDNGYDRWAHKWMVHRGDAVDVSRRLSWGINAPRITGNRIGAKYVWIDVAGEGQQIMCGAGKTDAYALRMGHAYVNGSLEITPNPALRNVPGWKWDWECTPQRLMITFDTAKYPEYNELVPFVLGYNRVTDPTRSSYTNTGTVTVHGVSTQQVETRAKVPSGSGSGNGTSPTQEPTPTPTPTSTQGPVPTQQPTPTEPPVPTPTPTVPPVPTPRPTVPPVPTPTATPAPQPKPTTPTSQPIRPPAPPPGPQPKPTPRPGPTGKPKPVPHVTRLFQVDTYDRRTLSLARLARQIVADRRLGYREDRRFWGRSTYEFVTVTVPANATPAQLLTAINTKSQRSANVITTSSRLPLARGKVTIAWELGRGATIKQPWGPRTNISQRYIARS